jgi:hypothetical protein
MDSQLRQMRTSYDPLQDRILLLVNTSDDSEYRLWITRRYVLLLWKVIGGIADRFSAQKGATDPMTRTALSELAQEKALQGADFQSNYEAGLQLPLGEEPVLLARIESQTKGTDRQLLRLLPDRGQGIDLLLDEKLVHLLASMLRQTATAAEWGLDLGGFAPTMPAQPGAAPRHLH